MDLKWIWKKVTGRLPRCFVPFLPQNTTFPTRPLPSPGVLFRQVRHCERSEAIHDFELTAWIATPLRVSQ
jgi:hypothetical protein